MKTTDFIALNKINDSLLMLEHAHYSLKVITNRIQQLSIIEMQPFMNLIEEELFLIEEEIKFLIKQT